MVRHGSLMVRARQTRDGSTRTRTFVRSQSVRESDNPPPSARPLMRQGSQVRMMPLVASMRSSWLNSSTAARIVYVI